MEDEETQYRKMYSSVTVSRGISGAIKMVRLVNSRSSGLPRVCTTG